MRTHDAMSRTLVALLLALGLVGVAAGCGKKDTPQAENEAPPERALEDAGLVVTPPPAPPTDPPPEPPKPPEEDAGGQTVGAEPPEPPPAARPERIEEPLEGDLPLLVTRGGHRIQVQQDGDASVVRVRLPRSWAAESWTLKARVLNPSGVEVAAAELSAADAGGQDPALRLAYAPTGAEWAVNRLEYVAHTGSGAPDERAITSLNRMRPTLSVRVLAADTLLAGGPAAVRVVVAGGAQADVPIAGANVVVSLGGKELLTAKTGADGSIDRSMNVPEDAESGELEVRVAHGSASERVRVPVTVRRERRILMTTDKPMYQPGQQIHVRLLAMKRPALVPIGDVDAVIEIFDPKGNKIFKRRMKTTAHGVAHGTLQLASEVIMGTYRIKATVGDSEVERTVEVKRYVLPKFKVTVQPSARFYLPGGTIEGTVDAQYFFGKAVRGKVELTLETFDVGWSRVATAEGTTNESGVWSFSVKLPESLVGQPLAQWKAMARLTAKVVDTAGQDEEKVVVLPVAPEPLRVDVVVPGQRLVPGIHNEVLVLAATPDGRPIEGASVALKYGGETQNTTTNKLGIAPFVVTGGRSGALQATVATSSGATVTKSLNLTVAGEGPQVMLSLTTPVADVGDTLSGLIRATGGLDRVFVDVIRDGQPILTATVPLVSGEGPLEIPLTADHVGTLVVQAYHIGSNMTVVRDARPVLVRPAAGLKVGLEQAESTTYKPGEEATLTLSVKDSAGSAVGNAAIGVRIVDEAVFALAEQRPGLERLFFALEEELLTPKLEVHAFSLADLADDTRRRAAAQVLSAAASASWEAPSRTDTHAIGIAAVTAQYTPVVQKDAGEIWSAFQEKVKEATRASLTEDVWKALGDEGGRVDPWGNAYRLDPDGAAEADDAKVEHFFIRSAGPDEAFDTGDDITESTRALWEKEMERRRRTMMVPTMAMEGGIPEPSSVPDSGTGQGAGAGGGGDGAVRVRQYFPETLYVNPLVITDAAGRAELKVAMADSITTWRLSATASDVRGRLGSGTDGVVVFQDFFVDLDLPESMTQNDELTVQVAVYNYMKEDETLVLTPDVGTAFTLLDGAEPIVLTLQPGEVTGAVFRVRAVGVGTHPLTLLARGTTMSDAVRRTVRIVPDGQEQVATVSGAVDTEGAGVEARFDRKAIEGADQLLVKLYPGSFSQVVEGLDSVLRMPSGCFEQTSSTTYPNVLALSYMRGQEQVTPEVEAKALSYINQGWQRLLTFEVDGGGFSWFGDQPANKVLTAFGVQEFADMAKVFEMDPAVLLRTQAWLAGQQEPDGTWKPDKSHLHDENWGDIQKGSLLVTAYVARALAASGYQGPALDKAVGWLKDQWSQVKDAYTLSLIAGALAILEPNGTAARGVFSALGELVVKSEDGKTAHWPAGVRTAVYGNGLTANIETTALVLWALMTAKQQMDLVGPGLVWLTQQKDSNGTWHATMPTILALTALVKAMTDSSEVAEGVVKVALDGKVVQEWTLNADNADVVRQLDLSDNVRRTRHRVTITMEGKGTPTFQVVSRYWLPRGRERAPERPPAFEMSVAYDKTNLATRDIVTATATVQSKLPADSKMVLLDLAVPPGFEVLRQDLDAAVAEERIERYRIAGRQIIVYLEEIKAGASFALTYRLRATTPVKAQSGLSRVYEYYEPQNEGRGGATTVVVDG